MRDYTEDYKKELAEKEAKWIKKLQKMWDDASENGYLYD